MSQTIYRQARQATEQLLSAAKMQEGDLLVVGCSSSEVIGSKIGTDSRPETAQEIFSGICDALSGTGVFLAAQCCEHLNRALVVEAAYARAHGPVHLSHLQFVFKISHGTKTADDEFGMLLFCKIDQKTAE